MKLMAHLYTYIMKLNKSQKKIYLKIIKLKNHLGRINKINKVEDNKIQDSFVTQHSVS